MRIALKYCGSCNPEADLSRIGGQIEELALSRGWEMVSSSEANPADALVMLCGCLRTCIDKEEVRRQAKQTVLVAGRRLGWQSVGEEELPRAIVKAIQHPSPHQPPRWAQGQVI
ncbi:MAG TPA: hypothetical protein G4O03_01040 [Dehalococcoidia bacterium]|nr:hypothetical protein [Dehalococcoidia bacterium]